MERKTVNPLQSGKTPSLVIRSSVPYMCCAVRTYGSKNAIKQGVNNRGDTNFGVGIPNPESIKYKTEELVFD